MDNEKQDKKNAGMERRQDDRRKLADQRSDLCWDPVKKDRRAVVDRCKLSTHSDLPSSIDGKD